MCASVASYLPVIKCELNARWNAPYFGTRKQKHENRETKPNHVFGFRPSYFSRMKYATSCCCCCTPRTACLVIGTIGVLIALSNLVSYSMTMHEYNKVIDLLEAFIEDAEKKIVASEGKELDDANEENKVMGINPLTLVKFVLGAGTGIIVSGRQN